MTIEESIKKEVESLKPGVYSIRRGEKAKLFRMYYPFEVNFKMDSNKFCINCEQWIKVNDFKILVQLNLKGEKEISVVCPNAPECDGSTIDWKNMDHFGNTNPPVKPTKKPKTYREILKSCSRE